MKGIRTVLGGFAKLDDPFQLPLKKTALQIKGSLVQITAKVRRLNNEIVDDRAFFARVIGTTEQAPAALDELAGIG